MCDRIYKPRWNEDDQFMKMISLRNTSIKDERVDNLIQNR